jgi:O-succinylhomoserine sulfhydrylase
MEHTNLVFFDINQPETIEGLITPENSLQSHQPILLLILLIWNCWKYCQKHNLILIIDNCFATPYLQQPIKWGAHLVVHSATKLMDGQGRVLAERW